MSERIDIELAADQPLRRDVQSGEQYIVVQIADASYAVALTSVQEVEHVPNVATVPGSPDWVLGVVNLRGTILTLVDAAALLGVGTWQASRSARMLVAGGDDPVAIAVDRLRGMRRIAELMRSPVAANLPGRSRHYVTGVHNSDGEWLSVLDVERLLVDADGMTQSAYHGDGFASERWDR